MYVFLSIRTLTDNSIIVDYIVLRCLMIVESVSIVLESTQIQD